MTTLEDRRLADARQIQGFLEKSRSEVTEEKYDEMRQKHFDPWLQMTCVIHVCPSCVNQRMSTVTWCLSRKTIVALQMPVINLIPLNWKTVMCIDLSNRKGFETGFTLSTVPLPRRCVTCGPLARGHRNRKNL